MIFKIAVAWFLAAGLTLRLVYNARKQLLPPIKGDDE